MTLSGTEADIINCVARLRLATKDQIRRDVGFSLDYVGFLCQYLVRKGYLTFDKGRYSLAKEKKRTLLTEETPKIDRNLFKKIASGIAKEVSGELKKAAKGIKIPISQIKNRLEQKPEEQIEIKTDFDLPTEDQSLTLESNIDKIGANLEKEKSDIENKATLLKKFQKRRKR